MNAKHTPADDGIMAAKQDAVPGNVYDERDALRAENERLRVVNTALLLGCKAALNGGIDYGLDADGVCDMLKQAIDMDFRAKQARAALAKAVKQGGTP